MCQGDFKNPIYINLHTHRHTYTFIYPAMANIIISGRGGGEPITTATYISVVKVNRCI